MSRIEEQCLDCGSPVVDRRLISHAPFLKINVLTYSCGARLRRDETGRLFHSGCSRKMPMALPMAA